nr:hypothetical protein [Desulfobacterales bacterium]
AVTTFCAPPEPGAAVDVLLTAEGLARPGGEVLPADEFLRREFLRPGGQPDVRGHALRKLVRVADPPAGRFGLRLPGPTGDRPLLEILRVE